MSKMEEGRTAYVDSVLMLTGSAQSTDRVGDEAYNNVDKFLKNISGRSVEEAYLVANEELFHNQRKK